MLPYKTIEQILKYSFNNPEVLLEAMTHRSYLNESDAVQLSNERLEFLGDSILNFLVARALFLQYPAFQEGQLSNLRSQFVSKQACAYYLSHFDLLEHLLVARGEAHIMERSKEGILADLYEALLGAVFLDGGFEAAQSFFERTALPHFEYLKAKSKKDYKALLQDYVLRKMKVLPSYELLFEEGPEHSKSFLVAVFIDAQEAGRGRGSTKKQAEQQAAMEAVLYHGWQDEQTKAGL